MIANVAVFPKKSLELVKCCGNCSASSWFLSCSSDPLNVILVDSCWFWVEHTASSKRHTKLHWISTGGKALSVGQTHPESSKHGITYEYDNAERMAVIYNIYNYIPVTNLCIDSTLALSRSRSICANALRHHLTSVWWMEPGEVGFLLHLLLRPSSVHIGFFISGSNHSHW